MNESNSNKLDEGRLIDYLLNESSSEERMEIERFCGENPDWQKAKKELESTLGLIEDAGKQPVSEIEGGMELGPGRRKELESLRVGKITEPVEQVDQKTETEERILIFKPAVWVPLAAAACAAVLVWAPGLMDQETTEEQLAAVPQTVEKIGKKEQSQAMAKGKATLRSEELGSAQSDDGYSDPNGSVELARLMEKPKGANLELEEDLTIAVLERRALDGANAVLNNRFASELDSLSESIANDVERISLADAFSQPSAESANFSINSAPTALSPQQSAPLHSIPAPVVSADPAVPLSKEGGDNPAIEEISHETSGQGPRVGVGADFAAQTESLDEEDKKLEFRGATSDDLLASGKRSDTLIQPQDLDAGFKIDTVRGRELSDIKKSAKTRKNNRFYSDFDQKRSKPLSWTTLVRKPSSCFLFNKNGQALGQVVVNQSAGKTSLIRRMGEIRQGKRFILTPGQFELRMTDQSGAVVILSGELKRKPSLSGDEVAEGESTESRDGDYEFVAKEAWWLDQSEIRQALPINELTR